MNVGRERGMRSYRGMGSVAIVALLGFALGCGGDAQADNGGEDPSREFVRIVNVEVAEVTPRRFTQKIGLTGVVRAMQDVVVSAEESGVVRQIVRDKGRAIRSGQAILRLDAEILKAQVQTAQAQAQLAEEVWQRRKTLYEEDGIGSEVSYLEAKYQAQQTQGSLAVLQERLARTTIVAPISGILDERRVEVGSMVSPGTPVARVVQVDPVKILAGVPERLALDVAVGASATVSFDVLSGEAFDGTITYVGATVDPGSRTFSVELTLPNPGGRIKPEMVANISLVQRVVDDAIVIPQEALVRVEDGYVAFVAAADGGETVVRAHPVAVGPAQGNEAVIESGLSPGDRVVIVGQLDLADGDRVRVVAGSKGGRRE